MNWDEFYHRKARSLKEDKIGIYNEMNDIGKEIVREKFDHVN
jgi:hypothetical protein